MKQERREGEKSDGMVKEDREMKGKTEKRVSVGEVNMKVRPHQKASSSQE